MVKFVRRRARAVKDVVAGALATGALLVGGGRAFAHPELAPMLTNRYVSLVAVGGRVDVSLTLLFGDLPAGERRREMDTDGDGRLSAGEVMRERLAWVRRGPGLLAVSVDGQPVTLETVASIDLNGEPRVTATPLLVEVGGSLPLSPGRRRLSVEPRWDPPRLGETEVRIDLSASWRLLGSGPGRAEPGPAPQTQFRFEGPRRSAAELRAVEFLVSGGALDEGRGAGGGPPGWLPAVIAAGTVLAGGTALALRRRARRRNGAAAPPTH